MSKEQYYNKIKIFIYRKFEELEVVERDKGNVLYIRYNNEIYAQILIEKKSGKVYYSYRLSKKMYKIIPLETTDFEILLKRWVEDTFKIKVINIKMRFSRWSPMDEHNFKIKF